MYYQVIFIDGTTTRLPYMCNLIAELQELRDQGNTIRQVNAVTPL